MAFRGKSKGNRPISKVPCFFWTLLVASEASAFSSRANKTPQTRCRKQAMKRGTNIKCPPLCCHLGQKVGNSLTQVLIVLPSKKQLTTKRPSMRGILGILVGMKSSTDHLSSAVQTISRWLCVMKGPRKWASVSFCSRVRRPHKGYCPKFEETLFLVGFKGNQEDNPKIWGRQKEQHQLGSPK